MIRNTFIIASFVVSVGCGAKQKTQHDIPMHQPPSDDQVVMPQGPPVITEGVDTTEIQRVSNDTESGATISKSELDRFLAKGPPFALSQVTVEPEKEDGRMIGFRIVTMTPSASEATTALIQVGDVVTHVNGIELKIPDDYIAAWRSLNDSSAIRVDLLRNGIPTPAIWAVK